MAISLTEIEEKALKLSPADRAMLASHLIASLDELSDEQNEQLWLLEAERRDQAFREGQISARSAEEVLRDARNAIT